MIGPVFDGPVGVLLLPPHVAAASPAASTTIAPIVNRFIDLLLPGCGQNLRVMLNPR
jgi:hypothetical protein